MGITQIPATDFVIFSNFHALFARSLAPAAFAALALCGSLASTVQAATFNVNVNGDLRRRFDRRD